ncbi:hypothetical protein [Chengkuizengella sediminis]|uniref:hypothetical protein n=1 Tax=Chengkuizengella sediminis TaxID=1885917 RepID=UPI00147841AD|nr:hypothetical protein [Chengkuizengella sediminis]
MSELFHISIVNQHWIEDKNEEVDLCSHGQINLRVNNTIITAPDLDEEWGISESALSLLRSLRQDINSSPETSEGLILHGCGLILMIGCPISIHWSVEHANNMVKLSDFIKITSTNSKDGYQSYPNLSVEVTREEYKNQIVSFALSTKQYFDKSADKKFEDKYEKEMYLAFWNEFNHLLITT